MRHSLAGILLLTLTACSLFQSQPDDSANNKNMSVEKIYAEAKTALTEGSYDTAIKSYENLQSRYPYGRYAQQALLEMAYAYYKQGEGETAISTVDRFIKLYPNHTSIDYAYYLRGLANFNGDMSTLNVVAGMDPSERDPKAAQASFLAFKELVARFPDSKYTPDAKVRMQYLVNALAKYEIHVAQYYVRRGAYIAAVNRAQNVLSQFPNSPSTRSALEILVQSYDALGMTDLRDDAKRVLSQNADAKELIQMQQPGKAWWQFWR